MLAHFENAQEEVLYGDGVDVPADSKCSAIGIWPASETEQRDLQLLNVLDEYTFLLRPLLTGGTSAAR